jgi:hypothetical protein
MAGRTGPASSEAGGAVPGDGHDADEDEDEAAAMEHDWRKNARPVTRGRATRQHARLTEGK